MGDQVYNCDESLKKKSDSQNNPPCLLNHEISSIKASISTKASPLILKPWIDMSLTLNGRDKITKVLQYSSRLLGFYYERIAIKMINVNGISSTTNAIRAASALSKAKRFRKLQKSLTRSRKAYRLGRTVIELDKLRNIGILSWIAWYLRQCIFSHPPPVRSTIESVKEGNVIRFRKGTKFEKKEKVKDQEVINAVDSSQTSKHSPKIKLPKKVSSNLLGSNMISAPYRKESSNEYRQLSSVSRYLYVSLSSFVDTKQDISMEAPPLWKIVSSVFKLVGLAGFWAADNVSFLHSTGFLGDGGKVSQGRAKNASIFAARCYFFASFSGLYLNLRELLRHRRGPLQEATLNLYNFKSQSTKYNAEDSDMAYKMHSEEDQKQALKVALEKAKLKHGSLTVALLKSCCDVMVFSNNPGIDLHLKCRGRKMNEGIQCAFGITSALTVIYNSFPINKKP